MRTEYRSPQAILKTEVDRRKFQKHPLEMMHKFLFASCCALKTSESLKGDALSSLLPPYCVCARMMHACIYMHMHSLAFIYNLQVEWQECFLSNQGR